MADIIIIQERLIKATNISQFRCSITRKRNFGQPYWIIIEDKLVFSFISHDTNVTMLKNNIENGIIFIQEKYKDVV